MVGAGGDLIARDKDAFITALLFTGGVLALTFILVAVAVIGDSDVAMVFAILTAILGGVGVTLTLMTWDNYQSDKTIRKMRSDMNGERR